MATTNRPTWRARRAPARKNPAATSAQPVSVHWRESQEPPIPLASFDGELNFDRDFRGHRRYRVTGDVLPGRHRASDLWDAPLSEPFRIQAHQVIDEVNAPEHQVDAANTQVLLWFGIDETNPASDIFQIDTSGGLDTEIVPTDCQTLGELSYVVKMLRRAIHAACVKYDSHLNLVFAFGFANTRAVRSDIVTDAAITRIFGERIDGILVLYTPVNENIDARSLLAQIQSTVAARIAELLSVREDEVLAHLKSIK